MQILESEALAEFLPGSSTSAFASSISIAVNDDSLSTWLLTALASLYQDYGYLFDIHRDDQEHTLEFLKSGAVLGAITSESEALQGCQVHFLGAMRYHAIASPLFVDRFFGAGIDTASLSKAPLISYNRKDDLQWRFLQSISPEPLEPPIHYIPSTVGLVEAAERQLGWCMMAEGLFEAARDARRLVDIAPGHHIDVPMYWQHAAIRSITLEHITKGILKAASKNMHL